jgi:TetR/AcrR family fatty acid metabolism transcriptional regulator
MVSKHSGSEPSLSTREAILQAASEVFGEVGYHHMTIDEVAKRANLGKGTIYLYFESKQDLALSILMQMNERVRKQHRQTLKLAVPPTEKLRKMLMERILLRFDLVRDYREGIDQMYSSMRSVMLERKRACLEEEALDFVEVLVEGRTLGVFECEDPAATARALISATASLLPYSLSPSELGSRKELEARAATLVNLLVRALRPCDSFGSSGHDTLERER